jgi:hypothetical protein
LEERTFDSFISERRFDNHTFCEDSELRIALCVFGAAPRRSLLENAGFDFVVEAALGGSFELFDNIVYYTFPGSYKTAEIFWGEAKPDISINSKLLQELCQQLFVNDHQSAQVVSDEQETNVFSCSFHSFFCDNVIKSYCLFMVP